MLNRALNIMSIEYVLLLMTAALIIGVNITIKGAAAGQQSEDVEVIYLPSISSMSIHENLLDDEIPLAFEAFGRSIELKLQKNRKLVAPAFQVWRQHNDRRIVNVPELNEPSLCHYIHSDSVSTAAVSLCEEGIVNGLVFLENVALEITPLRREGQSMDILDVVDIVIDEELSYDASSASSAIVAEPHVVKRSYLSSASSVLAANSLLRHQRWHQNNNSFFGHRYNDRRDYDRSGSSKIANKLMMTLVNESKNKRRLSSLSSRRSGRKRHEQENINESKQEIVIELGVFFDEAAYNLFSPFLDRNEMKIRDMLLAYVNGVQALFHHRSLGARIDLALVRLEIMKKQPYDLPHYDGERERLLDSFCRYAANHNPIGDDNPHHWDMGLYVSALDFYAFDNNGRRNGVTMGLAPVNGVCHEQYACVIAELGVTNRFGKPYPSAGFTSVYISAHEIGHNLGMRHDSSDNSCTKDGFIMSPSRGTQGETIWSPCSRDIALKLHDTKACLTDIRPPLASTGEKHDPSLDHGRHRDSPGREWTSKRQCEFLLRDKDAKVVTLSNVCQALQCATPHRTGYYYAGPALEGTVCAHGKECRGGDCLTIFQDPPTFNNNTDNDNGVKKKPPPPPRCNSSGCIADSIGIVSIVDDVVLCRDENLCKERVSVKNFAANRCHEYGEHLPEIDRNGGGLQAPHESAIPWMACAVFCRRSDIASYYAPRIELNDLGLDPYFPDGTWCHRERDRDYFCLRHHCLPENFEFGKDSYVAGPAPRNIDAGRPPPSSMDNSLDNNPAYPPTRRTNDDADDSDAWIDYIELPEERAMRQRRDSTDENKSDRAMTYHVGLHTTRATPPEKKGQKINRKNKSV